MMTKAKFILFGRSLLVSNSIRVDEDENGENPTATFLMNGDAKALTDAVFNSPNNEIGFSVYHENGDWCQGGIELVKNVEPNTGEPVIQIANYSKQMRHLIPDNQEAEQSLANGG